MRFIVFFVIKKFIIFIFLKNRDLEAWQVKIFQIMVVIRIFLLLLLDLKKSNSLLINSFIKLINS